MDQENFTELSSAISELTGAVSSFKESADKNTEGLQNRLEEIEALQQAGGIIGNARDKPKYRTLFTHSGQKAFVCSKGEKLADIPELQAKTELSLGRWLNALLFGSDCGDREAREYLVEQSKSVTTGSTGVLIPAAFVPEWIDLARAQSVLFEAGATMVTMPEKTLTYAHQTGDPTASWQSSEGASLSASDPTFETRVLTAKTLAVRTQVSLEAAQDIPDFGEQISRAYSAALGVAIDQAGFSGVAPAPTGLHTLAGVNKVTSVGTPTNWDEIVDGVTTYLVANNRLENLSGIAMHPSVWSVYSKLKTGISSDETPLELPPQIANVPRFVSTGADVVVSPQSYHITMGNFADLVVGIRMNPSIRILDATTSMATNLLVEVIGVARIDILALRPGSFVVLEDVTIS